MLIAMLYKKYITVYILILCTNYNVYSVFVDFDFDISVLLQLVYLGLFILLQQLPLLLLLVWM